MQSLYICRAIFFILSNISTKIYTSIKQLPDNWDVVAIDNAFLQTAYLTVLEESAPLNMQCFYIGIYQNNTLIGVALSQYLNLNKLQSFGDRDKCLKTAIRNFIFKNFASHVLFIGNNMITGQNGYTFNTTISFEEISAILLQIANEITNYYKKQKITIHLVTFKDFYQECAFELKKFGFKSIYEFKTQPNMVFELPAEWKTIVCYTGQLSKKYRDQYKRAHKKSEGIEVRELTLAEIIENEEIIYELYYYVAENAPFNTFFLAKNHFSIFKKQLKEQFVFCGYFIENQLVGFHTLLLNGTVLETYFLGYEEKIQKEKMLYLNMLYNMTQYGIEKQYKKIIFGRTALEIKSSVGAKPIMMSGFLYHKNKIANSFIDKIFKKLEPDIQWQQRHPFKIT